MHDFFILFAQSAVVALEAAWLTMAVHDNIRHPRLNEREFSRVVGMELVKQDPEVYREVSGRRIENPRLEKLLFRLLVAAEATVAALLWLAALGLLLASAGLVGREAAGALGILAVLGFISIWASFLIGGEWFWYRIGTQPAQMIHFFLILWGIATLTFLAAAP
jgi:predicted small integral membrane protein